MRILILLLTVILFNGCFKLRGYYGSKGFDKVESHINPADILLPEGYVVKPLARGLNFPTDIT